LRLCICVHLWIIATLFTFSFVLQHLPQELCNEKIPHLSFLFPSNLGLDKRGIFHGWHLYFTPKSKKGPVALRPTITRGLALSALFCQ
jgi:hypothetical protein